jgi:glycosyltransferase involved in cell wall biosynthesis
MYLKRFLILCFVLPCLAARQNKPFLVAVTLFGHNSSSIIGDALQSAVGWVDTFVLIDTGTTDNTIDVAKKVVGSKLEVKQMKWTGSFSDARNMALQLATDQGGSWGVFLDTDERFVGDTSRIRDFLNTTKSDVVHMAHTSRKYAKVNRQGVLQPSAAPGPASCS